MPSNSPSVMTEKLISLCAFSSRLWSWICDIRCNYDVINQIFCMWFFWWGYEGLSCLDKKICVSFKNTCDYKSISLRNISYTSHILYLSFNYECRRTTLHLKTTVATWCWVSLIYSWAMRLSVVLCECVVFRERLLKTVHLKTQVPPSYCNSHKCVYHSTLSW